MHRSTSSAANPPLTSSAQKPSRRHSHDTHGTMHASPATAGAGMSSALLLHFSTAVFLSFCVVGLCVAAR